VPFTEIEVRLQGWDTFAELAGGAAATMTGLLFVAVSIRVDRIKESKELRNRAGQTLTLFGAVLVASVLVAIPAQADWTFGIELIALAALTGAALYLLDVRARTEQGEQQQFGRLIEAVSPNAVTLLLILAAGIMLVLGVSAGLYVLIAPILVGLIGGVASAWLFLTRDY
jgi:O-antigen/teichoic acid export membrane protein